MNSEKWNCRIARVKMKSGGAWISILENPAVANGNMGVIESLRSAIDQVNSETSGLGWFLVTNNGRCSFEWLSEDSEDIVNMFRGVYLLKDSIMKGGHRQ